MNLSENDLYEKWFQMELFIKAVFTLYCLGSFSEVDMVGQLVLSIEASEACKSKWPDSSANYTNR
jgi:hypothetical protein